MTESEVHEATDHHVLYAVVNASEERKNSRSPGWCPSEIWLSPRGFIAYYPQAGTHGDPCRTLEQLLKEERLDPSWLTRVEYTQRFARSREERHGYAY